MGFVRRRLVNRLFASIASLMLALCSANLWPQNPNGTLRGEVQDTSGARVAGATVSADASGSALVRDVMTDDKGEFRIEGLLPGPYRVPVQAKGFNAEFDTGPATVLQ